MYSAQKSSLTFISIMFLLITSIPVCSAEELAKARKDTAIKESPSRKSASIGSLKKNDVVKVIERKGLWVLITSDTQGWVSMTGLSFSSASNNTQSSLSGLKSGRQGAGNAVSSTGVRGLDAEMISVANPNYQAVDDLVSQAVTSKEAAFFGQDGNLKTRTINYLAPPKNTHREQTDKNDVNIESSKETPKPKPSKKRRKSDDDW